MNLKNFIFCALVANSISYVRCSDMEQKSQEEQKLSNYEKLLKKFPDILPTLQSNDITKDDINDAKLNISEDGVSFMKDNLTVVIQKTGVTYEVYYAREGVAN